MRLATDFRTVAGNIKKRGGAWLRVSYKSSACVCVCVRPWKREFGVLPWPTSAASPPLRRCQSPWGRIGAAAAAADR